MLRDYKVYLDDILEAAARIDEYASGFSFEEFCADQKTIDAVVRNLEVIGEAAKNIPDEIRQQHSDVEWKKIAGLRDILIHEYFGINVQIVWDIIQQKLPVLNKQVRKFLSEGAS